MPLENIPSVLKHGILSNERSGEAAASLCRLEEAQEKRDAKQVPGGLKLHQYANLYFHARNPMMSNRRNKASSLCVLPHSARNRQCRGVIIADRNAAGDGQMGPLFFIRASGLCSISIESTREIGAILIDSFTMIKKRKKCAEVLVPHLVKPEFLVGAYVADTKASDGLRALGFTLPISIDSDLFFR